MSVFLVRIAQAAEEDLREAFLWYEDQQAGLGSKFEKAFRKSLTQIRENPKKFQIRYSTVRVCFLKNFPYGIHFTIDDQQVLIAAVFHTSRNPRLWNERSQ